MVNMQGMVDPTDDKVTNLLRSVETLGFSAEKIGDITDHIKDIVDRFENMSDLQRKNFMATLLFNYAGYYSENFKARQKAEYCKRMHASRRY